MAQKAARIVSDEGAMGGEPRIEGRRITVRQIAERVAEGGFDARTVADQLDLDVADVYRVLASSHDHPGAMARIRTERRELEERSRGAGAPSLAELQGAREGE